MRAIFGLGNPGNRYRLTRHNIGFILLDYIQSQFEIPFSPGKGDYYFCKVYYSGNPVLLVKPTTYMNRSGLAVYQVLKYFPIEADDILVVYDDFHLSFGKLRFRAKGSAGGHNGIKSIISHLHSEEFDRLKIGIGSAFDDSVDFVLSKFAKDERKEIDSVMKTAYDGIKVWLESGVEEAMNEYNRNVLDTNTK